MSRYNLPPIAGIRALSTIERVAILDALFEPCTALHTLSVDLLHTQKFESYNDLIASIGVQLADLSESASTSDTEWLDKILGAHPRLGEKKVESAQSKAEQAQLNTGGVEEAVQLKSLNEDYEKTFPGLRYVYDDACTKSIKQVANNDQRLCEWQVSSCDHGRYEGKNLQGGYQAWTGSSNQSETSYNDFATYDAC